MSFLSVDARLRDFGHDIFCSFFLLVIPAQAGIHCTLLHGCLLKFTPAQAGVACSSNEEVDDMEEVASFYSKKRKNIYSNL